MDIQDLPVISEFKMDIQDLPVISEFKTDMTGNIRYYRKSDMTTTYLPNKAEPVFLHQMNQF